MVNRLLLGGALIALLGGSLYLFWRHYDGLVADKARLETRLEAQTLATQEALAAIQAWKGDRERMIRVMDEVNKNAREARNEAAKVHEIFAGHDLEELARRRPGLIETRINRGSAAVLERLQCASRPGGICPGETGATSGDRSTTGPGPDQDVSSSMENNQSWWSRLLRRDP